MYKKFSWEEFLISVLNTYFTFENKKRKTMIKFQALADILILTLQTGPRSPIFILSMLVMREESPRVTDLKWPLTTAGKNDRKYLALFLTDS